MWLYEVLSWVALGLTLALGRYFFTEEPGNAGRVFGGSAVAALLAGIVASGGATESVVVATGYSAMSLLIAGMASLAFIAAEWFVSHRSIVPTT